MTRFEKTALLAAFSLAFSLLTSSCGYHLGTFGHPQIKTIAVAPVKNDTLEPLASAVMRQQLCEQFQFDGSFKVKEQGEADCIMHCRIIEVKNTGYTTSTTDHGITYRPSEFNIQVKAEISVVIPGREEPLVSKREVSGWATYDYTSDPNTGRMNGLKQACYEAARLAVEYTAEGF